MKHSTKTTLTRMTAMVLVTGVAACGSSSSTKAPIDDRRTTAGQAQGATGGASGVPVTSGGIRDYGDYQAAVAQPGDTVSGLADRVGLSASELGAYNGLAPNHVLRDGDELVLPPRPGGYSADGLAGAVPNSPTLPQSSGIEATPLDGGIPVTDAGLPETTATGDAWSPELAAAAIEQATGIDDQGNLAAPPSSVEPLPDNPATPDALASPNLQQYQTTPVARPATEVPTTDVPAADPPASDAGEQIATIVPEPAPTPAPTPTPSVAPTTLARPVDGPVAIGFRRGTGASRNDGVDFATPPGAPVVAADDGEVALVSQSLGGLGTIVLLRHGSDLLTVYGRIDDVSLKKGELVTRGQQIGKVANPPSGSEARMHFEVRRGAESLDPLQFIPG